MKNEQEKHWNNIMRTKDSQMEKLQKRLSGETQSPHIKEFNVFHQIESDIIDNAETVSAESVIYNVSDDELQRNISNLNALYNQAENITSDHWLDAMLKLGNYLNAQFSIRSIPMADPPPIDFRLKQPIDRIRVGLSLTSLLRLYLNEVRKTDLLNTECNRMGTDIRHYRKLIDDLHFKAKQREKTYQKNVLYLEVQHDKTRTNLKTVKMKNKVHLKTLSDQKTHIAKLERDKKGNVGQSETTQDVAQKRVLSVVTNLNQRSPKGVKQISALENKIFELKQQNKSLRQESKSQKQKLKTHFRKEKDTKEYGKERACDNSMQVHRIPIPAPSHSANVSCTDRELKQSIQILNAMYCEPKRAKEENWRMPLAKLGYFLNHRFCEYSVPCEDPFKINFILKNPIDRIRVGLSLYSLLNLYLRQKDETESFVAESNKLIADIQNHTKLNRDLHFKLKQMEKQEKSIAFWQMECQRSEEKFKSLKTKHSEALKGDTNVMDVYHGSSRLNEDLQFKMKQMEAEKDKQCLFYKLEWEKGEEKFKLIKKKQWELHRVTKKLVSELSREKRKNKQLQDKLDKPMLKR